MVEATKQPFAYDVLPHETIAGMAGRQVLDAIVDGRLPQAPISQVLNFWLTEDGVAAFEGEPAAHLLDPAGVVDGGWALTLMDSAGACAAHTLLPSGVIAPQTGRVRAEARVVAQGRQIISAEVYVFGRYRKVMAFRFKRLLLFSQPRRPPS